jgi:hypothetical protein
MGGYSNSIIIVLAFVLVIFLYSQLKFQNKMLCYFLRPNKQRIRKFVPLFSRHVVFDRGKYGVERYRVDPQCIVLEKYTGGVNKLFPTYVPTLDFEWWNPNPRDPTTGKIQWHTPEVEAAGYNSQSYVGIARAMAQQSGGKRNKTQELLPLITLGLLVIVAVILYSSIGNVSEQFGNGMTDMQNQINIIKEAVK